MNIIYFIIEVLVLSSLLTSCIPYNKEGQNLTIEENKVFEDSAQKFSVVIPSILSKWTTISEGLEGPSRPYFISENDEKNLITATINNSSVPCSPSLTGASSTTPLLSANGEAAWGRVDFWDYTGALSALYNNAPDPSNVPPAPLCTPPDTDVMEETRTLVTCPTPEEKATLSEDDLQWLPCRQRMRDYEVKHGLNSAYALCSKKNDKTVVICISQMKDDPSLAKKIFETFRWTE